MVEGRRQAIMNRLLEREAVTVRELSEEFGVSAMTIHRDLDALEARGVLRKVHGGATAQPSSVYESSLGFREVAGAGAKRAIARHAVRHVAAGSSLLLDDSTTCLAMVPLLARIPQLTVVTNFLSAIEQLDSLDGDATVLVIGGTLDKKYRSLLGLLAEQSLEDIRVDRCFLSVNAVDVADGAFHPESHQARIKRAMMEVADSAVLLADASKLGKRALHRIAGLEAFDRIITDDSADPALIDALRSHGVIVEVASQARDEAF